MAFEVPRAMSSPSAPGGAGRGRAVDAAPPRGARAAEAEPERPKLTRIK